MDVGVLLFERPDGRTARRSLGLGATAIGRHSSNDIRLPHGKVSEHHARILLIAGEFRIRDLKSLNGTFINGERLVPDVDRALQPGDRIGIGPYTFRFELEAPAGEAAPPPESEEVPAVDDPGSPQPDLFHRRPFPRRLARKGARSRYLDLLPPIYDDIRRDPDGVINAILLICEQILDPLERTVISQLHYYIDPATAPEALLPWLASWVSLVLDENWAPERRRALVGKAAELYRWRGTRRGLSDYIGIFANVEPIIVEPGQEDTAPLPEGARRVQPSDGARPARLVALVNDDRRSLPAFTFRVFVPMAETSPTTLARLHQIVEAQKPAHTSYALYIIPTATT